MANFGCPDLKRLRLSSAKAEKVVNPPKRPTNKNNLKLVEMFPRSNKPQEKPIKNDPIIFTPKVPQGKTPVNNRCAQPETQKRSKVPAAPPIINANILFMLVKLNGSF